MNTEVKQAIADHRGLPRERAAYVLGGIPACLTTAQTHWKWANDMCEDPAWRARDIFGHLQGIINELAEVRALVDGAFSILKEEIV